MQLEVLLSGVVFVPGGDHWSVIVRGSPRRPPRAASRTLGRRDQ